MDRVDKSKLSQLINLTWFCIDFCIVPHTVISTTAFSTDTSQNIQLSSHPYFTQPFKYRNVIG